MIAVVDDEESVRKAVVRLLQAAGHTARGFATGSDFLHSYLDEPAECLLLDLQMPGLSGADVLRALNRSGARIPTIIVTAHDSPGAREECKRLGAVAYLCKPLDERVLLTTLQTALGTPH